MAREPTLRRGSRGAYVTRLQQELSAAGFDPGAADGIFGAKTDGAVRAFQAARGLTVDGVVGPKTWAALAAGGAAVGEEPSGVTSFSFQILPGEAVGARIVRCCSEALADGQMGQFDRHDFYRSFIACNQETSDAKAEALTTVRTSCAMFVRAVRTWCGAGGTGPYVPGTGMFVSMGNVNFNHPAFVPNDGSVKPNPGDYFYISSSQQSNDGHTGIFVEELSDGRWRTAEGGGGGKQDGTLCRFAERTMTGNKFHNDARTLWGWFDCTKVGLLA